VWLRAAEKNWGRITEFAGFVNSSFSLKITYISDHLCRWTRVVPYAIISKTD